MNAFTIPAKSLSLGRVQSDKQRLQNAKRVNPESNLGYADPAGADRQAKIVGRSNKARTQ